MLILFKYSLKIEISGMSQPNAAVMNSILSSSPSPRYRISTITATGSLNTEVNLDLLYQSLIPLCITNEEDGIVYTEYGKKKVETVYKGFSKKQKKMDLVSSDKPPTKRFDNQVTIVYRTSLNGVKCMMNTKVFKNGNVQMTGVRSITQGHQMIERIAVMIRGIYNTVPDIVVNIDNLGCRNYRLRLINSDFRVGYEIRREQLYKILMDNYKVCCSFEPCIYPAVKIKYYFNESRNIKDGICYCSKKCIIGKGCGSGDKLCKKVTIAVFQSGCIIITGGQSIEQVEEAYRYINEILSENIEHIKKKNVIFDDNDGYEDNFKVLIKTSNIQSKVKAV